MARFRLDLAFLERCRADVNGLSPRACKDLVSDCGGLAGWLLRDDVLRRAAEDWAGRLGNPGQARFLRAHPELPKGPGSCWAVFVVHPPERYPLLRPAFALPFRWRRVPNPDAPAWGADLPEVLARLARDVLQLLHAFQSGGVRSQPTDWCLRLAVDGQPGLYDLAGLTDLACDSAWAALAAGWLVAARGGTVDTAVWASACWRDGLRPVEHLSAKLHAARAGGARAFFVAAPQARDAAATDLAARLGLELLPLPDQTANPLLSLRPLARRLAVRPGPRSEYAAAPPGRDDFYHDSAAYYHLLRGELGDPAGAAAFYRGNLLPEIAADCRAQIPADRRQRPWRLATILSGSPELVELATRVFRPAACLLLYTEFTADLVEGVSRRVAESVPACRIEPLRVGRDLQPGRMPAAAHAFADAGPGADLALDLTPGTKLMTLALDRDLARPGCTRFYVMSAMPGQEIRFGTEEVVLL